MDRALRAAGTRSADKKRLVNDFVKLWPGSDSQSNSEHDGYVVLEAFSQYKRSISPMVAGPACWAKARR